MRLMLFYDLENLKQSLRKLDEIRFPDIGKFQYYLLKETADKAKISCKAESLIRTYAYTGEYTPHLLKKIEKDIRNEEDIDKRGHKEKVLEKSQKGYEQQQRELRISKYWNFYELRKIPLQYANGRVFQKGVDVQLAVDLVSHAFKNNFDVAVVCSGDIDLLESIRTIKSLGKKVIIASHPECMSKELIRASDYFLDFTKFPKEDYDEFSHVYIPKKED